MATLDIKSIINKKETALIQWQVNKESKLKVQKFMKKNKIQFKDLFDELIKALDDYEIRKEE